MRFKAFCAKQKVEITLVYFKKKRITNQEISFLIHIKLYIE